MSEKRTELGLAIEEAFLEFAAGLRGEVALEQYEIDPDVLTPSRIKAIRTKVAPSTKDFERQFRVPARTVEAYEQGRRRPDTATDVLLRVIEREPDAVRRALRPPSAAATDPKALLASAPLEGVDLRGDSTSSPVMNTGERARKRV
jgi:putative transcriptional regulator